MTSPQLITGPAGKRALAALMKSPRKVLAFDYDGTLAPIVRWGSQAKIPPVTARLFEALAERVPVAILSGRSSKDLEARFADSKARFLIGNHGMDWARPAYTQRRSLGRVKRWQPVLERALADCEGVEVENKRFTFSVHFRGAKNPREADRRILEVARLLPGVRIVGGKCVYNLVPEGALDKGTSLGRLMRVKGFERALFVGDDVTDEDVFRLRDRRIVDVRIGRSADPRAPQARFTLPTQKGIDGLLRYLIELADSGN